MNLWLYIWDLWLLNILRLDILYWLLNIRLLNNWLLDYWLLNNWLLNCAVCNNLWSLDWLIINKLFNSLLRNIIDFNFLSHVWNVFCDMFNLLIISVLFLNWNIVCFSNSLIFSYLSSDRYIFSSLLWNLFYVLSFIRDLDIIDLLFVISIGFLDGDVFNVWLV